MCLPGPTMKSYLFSVQTLCPPAQTTVSKRTELPARQQEPAVWRLWAIRGEKKKKKKEKKSEGGSQRKRAANRSECQTRSAWKALSEITSRHSWCEGGETADVNVVLTDWAMCTMSVITGSARWQDRSANLRGDRSGWSRAEIRRPVWTSWRTTVESDSVSTRWAELPRWKKKNSTGSDGGFTPKLGQTHCFRHQFSTWPRWSCYSSWQQ